MPGVAERIDGASNAHIVCAVSTRNLLTLQRFQTQVSSAKPAFSVTCQCATVPSTMWPRVSTT